MNPNLTAGNVMDTAASLLNDTAKSNYTYTVQIPYLNIALRELEENFQLNSLPVTDESSAVIEVPAGTTEIGYPPTVPVPDTPYLPANLVRPKLVWERNNGVGSYTPVNPTDVLEQLDPNIELSYFTHYKWTGRSIKVLPSNADKEVKILYVRGLFTPITSITGTDAIAVVSGESFLGYRTAALVAKFVAEDEQRSIELNGFAGLALDRVEGINIKGGQSIMVRRQPFRAAYKSGSR